MTMLLFGFAMRAHNPYLGFDGDFDEAAGSCFKTAAVFAALSLFSLATFVVSAMRAKPNGSAPQDYEPV